MSLTAGPAAQAIAGLVAQTVRAERGRLLALLISRLGDFQAAEDALQDAVEAALIHWGRTGPPRAPAGWLLTVASRKGIDRARRSRSEARAKGALLVLGPDEAVDEEAPEIPDHRLRLIFTCCHPALERKSQVALTLRTVAGLSTREIARAFLDEEATMGQRLNRAKAKIAAARVPFAVPERDAWPHRLAGVLDVILLIFNAGYPAGVDQAGTLADEAIFLARLLDRLTPGGAEIEGALALMLLIDARRRARIGQDGVARTLPQQDRGAWDTAKIAEGLALLDTALARRSPGPFQIKASIQACHVAGAASDWRQIILLYDALLAHEDTPIVRLNRAAALGEAGAVALALAEVDALAPALAGYAPYHATRAGLLARLGRSQAAKAAFDRALDRAESPAEAALLKARQAALCLRADTDHRLDRSLDGTA